MVLLLIIHLGLQRVKHWWKLEKKKNTSHYVETVFHNKNNLEFSNETILHIDLNKLEHNFNFLKSKLKKNTKIIGVVKAFAYGHGDVEISKRLEKLGAYALWVSDFEEGISLRKAGIKSKIIVANPGLKSYEEIIKYNLDIVIYNQRLLDLYTSHKKKINIHIKFNSGMNRYGFDAEETANVVKKIKNNYHLRLLSICSHLAASDKEEKSEFTINQIAKFKTISKNFEIIYGAKIDKHILNSNGVLNFVNQQMDIVRLGIGLYGSSTNKNLKQISRLSSVVTQIRNVEKGESVGYDPSFVAPKNMKIAIIPIGYADGLNRKFSSIGSVYINKKECKIIGNISMDSFAVNTSNLNIQEGETVEIFGNNLSVNEIAKKINTIPYEIYSTLNRRIKRVYSDS
ncbi:alanine racemase [Flavobacteriales bacterium]|nr:alanine racemase [Flavobacteriales bacterium]